jgi:hypothetical protein
MGVLMKIFNRLCQFTLLSVALNASASDLVIVTNGDVDSESLNKREVRDIFMGNNTQLGLKPLAFAPDTETRIVFNTKIVGLTESRIQSYWAQMRFSGRKKPPQEFASVKDILTYVKSHDDAIAYLPADTEIPEGLNVVYRTD